MQRFVISVESDKVDDTTANDLLTLIEKCAGPIPLYLRLCHAETHTDVMMRAREKGVNVTKELLNFLDSTPSMSYSVS